MLVPERVTAPVPVLVRLTAPSRMALTAPACRSKAVAEVSVPPLPVMLPEVSWTPLTVSLLAPKASVPPETTTFEVSAI